VEEALRGDGHETKGIFECSPLDRQLAMMLQKFIW
jgi:hypothetical protein